MKQKTDSASWFLEKTPAASGYQILHLTGSWKGDSYPKKPFSLEKAPGSLGVQVDLSGVTERGSSLPAFLLQVRRACECCSLTFSRQGLPEEVLRLLDLALVHPREGGREETSGWVERLGEQGLMYWDGTQTALEFLGDIGISLFRLVTFRARMRWVDLLTEMRLAGPSALGIVLLISYLMGLILAFVGAMLLKMFHAEEYVATLVGIGMFRLLGAVMTGMVMAGRTGASYAAELGTMRVNEEVDALSSMGISVTEFLVLPRMLAISFVVPFLCILADYAGLLGGYTVAHFYLDVQEERYWVHLMETTPLTHFYIGLFTSWIYGWIIGFWGCFRGLQCERSSAGVGKATTSAMVSSIISLVLATSLITVLTVLYHI